jgi:hypothetical protein
VKTPCFKITISDDTVILVANKPELKRLQKFISKAIDGAIKDGLGSIVSHVHPNPNDPHKICFVDCIHGLAD